MKFVSWIREKVWGKRKSSGIFLYYSKFEASAWPTTFVNGKRDICDSYSRIVGVINIDENISPIFLLE